MRLTVAVHGEPGSLAGRADLAFYRIVQEALTNATKHAFGQRRGLGIDWSTASVHLTVSNAQPAAAPEGDQKMMQYIVPVFALSGLYWQYGLVLYWVTTNLWTLGQQYVLFEGSTARPQRLRAQAAPATTGGPSPPARQARGPEPRGPGPPAGNVTAAGRAAARQQPRPRPRLPESARRRGPAHRGPRGTSRPRPIRPGRRSTRAAQVTR